jgi:hypothetical protein
MSTAVAAEQLYCANCSDPVEAVDEDGFGRCCHDLPNPWHRGGDGLYTEPSVTADPADEDEHDGDDEEDRRPECPYCGSRGFQLHARALRRVTFAQTVSGYNDELDDATLWYDTDDFEDVETEETEDLEVQRVVCTRCHNDVTGTVDIEERD